MSRTAQVAVDFNDLARNGKVAALKHWANQHITLGDHVIAADRFEDVRFNAVVAEVNGDTIYLELGEELTWQ